MVSIGLSAGAVARIRFAISALWEVASSVRVLRDPEDHAVHWRWAERVRRPLTDAGLIGAGGGLLWQLIPTEPIYMPDFLTPEPMGLDADLEAELAVLAATPARTVLADLSVYTKQPSGLVADMVADPGTGLSRLGDEIRAYWAIAIEPHWARIKTLLDGEVLYRARLLAEGGAGELLNDLHRRVRWEGDTLSIAHRACSAHAVSDGGGLVLVPSAFVWPSVASVAATEPAQLAYPPRGVATLWERSPEATKTVVNLIGRSRAQLLFAMSEPISTSELAQRTGISAGGVSQHLAVLRAAGLTVSYRRGKTVLNVRTTMAQKLLTAAA